MELRTTSPLYSATSESWWMGRSAKMPQPWMPAAVVRTRRGWFGAGQREGGSAQQVAGNAKLPWMPNGCFGGAHKAQVVWAGKTDKRRQKAFPVDARGIARTSTCACAHTPVLLPSHAHAPPPALVPCPQSKQLSSSQNRASAARTPSGSESTSRDPVNHKRASCAPWLRLLCTVRQAAPHCCACVSGG